MNTFPVLCFAYQAVKLLVSVWKTYVVREYRFLFHWLIYSISIWSKCRQPEIHLVWLRELTTNTVLPYEGPKNTLIAGNACQHSV
jgi:pyrroloquinoline quinone (PQQ) biosynthesis protein C